MKFIDNAVIFVKGGDGGDGAICFRKDKNNFSIKIPSGGDGGTGGSVYFITDVNVNTLIDFSFKRYYEAQNGERGKNNNSRGISANDILIKAPYGTQIFDYLTKEFIADLSFGDCVLVSKGGMRGLGNYKHLKNDDNYNYIKGGIGEFRILKLELKILADVALVGYPNSGKSTLIVKVSLSKSKIADYPFTTVYPKLGVVYYYHNNFIIADTPGIIKDASYGVGLGYNFLKHLLKSKLLLHVIDLSSKNKDSLIQDINIIKKELIKYSNFFLTKDMWIILNKIDLILRYKLLYIYRYVYYYYNTPIFLVSSLKGYGLKKLCKDISYYLFIY